MSFASAPQPFAAHDYSIECVPMDAPRVVNIGGRAAAPFSIGDRFTIDSRGCVYDLIVQTVRRLAGDRWTARCRVSEPLCL